MGFLVGVQRFALSLRSWSGFASNRSAASNVPGGSLGRGACRLIAQGAICGGCLGPTAPADEFQRSFPRMPCRTLSLSPLRQVRRQHFAERAQMRIGIVLTAREVQSRVSADVCQGFVDGAVQLNTLNSVGNNSHADAGCNQSNDSRRLQHLSCYARPKSGVRAYVQDLPVESGASFARIRDERLGLRLTQ